LDYTDRAESRISVLISDGQSLFASGLSLLLGEDERLRVVGVCQPGDDVYAMCRTLAVDVVISDIQFGEVAAPELVRRIHQISPHTAVLVVAAAADWRVIPAMQAGVAGYLLRDADPAAIRSAIVSVHLGEKVLCPQAARWLIADDSDHRLTRRESDVLTLMARGVANRDIAKVLSLDDKTVRNYVSKLYRKLEVDTRAEIVGAARQSDSPGRSFGELA
jgi:DNA-binding NarL/FixJ family response regulator